MASLFPRSFISHPSFADPSPSSFHPLFRLLDDFDQYSRSTGTNEGSRHHQRSVMKTFTPRFDVKETADTYELHGDLPGIDQKDITIEFTDAETLTVRGRTERSYSSGTPPSSAGAIEGSKTQEALKDKAHQPTVEDEGETAVATTSEGNNAVKEKKAEEEPKERYWVTERSVGEFQRTFTFPVRVDQDNVKASMHNGVLTVIVPKGKKAEPRRIQIN